MLTLEEIAAQARDSGAHQALARFWLTPTAPLDEARNYARDAVELLLLIGTEVMSDLNHLVCDRPVVCAVHTTGGRRPSREGSLPGASPKESCGSARAGGGEATASLAKRSRWPRTVTSVRGTACLCTAASVLA